MEKLVPIVGAAVLGAVRNDAPTPAPATAMATGAAGAVEPLPGLEAELRQLRKMGELRKRARAEGVDEDELDEAESKDDVIQLILGSPLRMSSPR